MIAKLLQANGRYLALAILSIVVIGYTSVNSMARKEDPAITPFFAKVQTVFPRCKPGSRRGVNHQADGRRATRRARR
jgi:multidrug efflux pump subunit AcrB